MAAMLAPVVQKMDSAIHQATVVQTLDSTIHWIEIYPLDSAILLLNNWEEALVVQRLDSSIHRINLYPMDSAFTFPSTYSLGSDLSGG